VNWILKADIKSFFDSLDRTKLKAMLQIRVADGSLLRLIGKLLRVGVLDGAEYSTPDLGTAQGSALSPLLGNVYLHYVLDAWFEQVVLPSLGGRATLVRYADDFVIGFERCEDAQRVMELLHERMASFGLTLHPDKTRLLPFRRTPASQQSGKGPATFDFLGFTLYWGRARSGRWCMWCKTRSSRLQRAIKVAAEWCRRHRHDSVAVQHAALLTITYPAATGRNFDEILRVIDALQLTSVHQVATPANWKDSEDVIIVPTVSGEDAKVKFPAGFKTIKPYLRTTAQPSGTPVKN
jgi:RNA-directed DNA polymerase